MQRSQRRRAQRVRAALKDRESKPEFDPAKRAGERAQEFVLRRRRGPTGERWVRGGIVTIFAGRGLYLRVKGDDATFREMKEADRGASM